MSSSHVVDDGGEETAVDRLGDAENPALEDVDGGETYGVRLAGATVVASWAKMLGTSGVLEVACTGGGRRSIQEPVLNAGAGLVWVGVTPHVSEGAPSEAETFWRSSDWP